jgi:uncharacterized protein (UPF0335 family)
MASLGLISGILAFTKKDRWKAGPWIICLSLLVFVGGNMNIGEFSPSIIKDSFNQMANKVEKLENKVDELSAALGKVYEKYYEVETFDCSKESQLVNYAEKDGHIYIKLKLKYRPILNSLQIFCSGGYNYWPSLEKTEIPVVDENLFLWANFADFKSIDELRTKAKENKLMMEVRYLRKE